MEPIPDPCNDRQVPSQIAPPQFPLSKELLFPSKFQDGSGFLVPDCKALKEHLFREGRVLKEDVHHIVKYATVLLKKEPNILKISEPIVVIGDIHGQFYDLVHIFEKAGEPSKIKYFFLGDYVDRGIFSLECVLLIYAYKIKYPSRVFMIRGNHESRSITEHFTFRQEVLQKYDLETYDLIMESFDTMPLAGILNGQYFAVHGGISPQLTSLKDIHQLNRFQEVPLEGLLCDLVWSDPLDDKKAVKHDFKENVQRACSYKFGLKPAKALLEANDLTLMIRAHQVQVNGYKMHYWEKPQTLPTVITLFSAPNYCDVYGNKAAIIKLEGENFSIKNFDKSPHPFHLPGNLNLFEFSIPYMAEKVLDMFHNMWQQTKYLKDDQDEELKDEMDLMLDSKEDGKGGLLRRKVKAIGRMKRIYKNLKENHDTLIKIKAANDGRIPRGLLLAGKPAIRDAFKEFDLACKLDEENEKRPLPKTLVCHTHFDSIIHQLKLDDGSGSIVKNEEYFIGGKQ